MFFVPTLIKRLILILILSGLVFIYLGVQGEAFASNENNYLIAQAAALQATLTDPTGVSSLSGQVLVTEMAGGVNIDATVADAPPGLHGFHIHANGMCADAGNAAGGHFNPDNVKHGKLNTDGFENAHAGDLGNILIDSDGTGSLRATFPGLTLTDGRYGLANHAVILHANQDDFSQPTGNAGGRIGCGILAGS